MPFLFFTLDRTFSAAAGVVVLFVVLSGGLLLAALRETQLPPPKFMPGDYVRLVVSGETGRVIDSVLLRSAYRYDIRFSADLRLNLVHEHELEAAR